MTGTLHHAQLLVEMWSQEIFAQADWNYDLPYLSHLM
jgi:hypothetical protein